MPAAGTTANAPVNVAIRPSFEFASTRSLAFRTTDGTIACFVTAYVFCSTRAANTNGNRAIPSAVKIMPICTPTREIARPTTIARRPPRSRSIIGPNLAFTIRNGANPTSKNASNRERAASRSTSKKNESASASTIDASPAVITAWVIASD